MLLQLRRLNRPLNQPDFRSGGASGSGGRGDPANTAWQRDAGVAHELIGEVLVKQKQFENAASEFRKFYVTMTKLAARRATDADLLALTAGACAQVALVDMLLKDKGDLPEASKAVQQGLAILTELEKRRAPPPQTAEIRNKLEWLARALVKPVAR